MVYRLTARDRIFCEGTLAVCQNNLTEISRMISAGLATDFQLEEFLIVYVKEKQCSVKKYSQQKKEENSISLNIG